MGVLIKFSFNNSITNLFCMYGWGEREKLQVGLEKTNGGLGFRIKKGLGSFCIKLKY